MKDTIPFFYIYIFRDIRNDSLTATLARDLQSHFIPFFERISMTLIDLVEPKDPELVEDIFSTFGFLFKFLRKHLVQDLPHIFGYAKLNEIASHGHT